MSVLATLPGFADPVDGAQAVFRAVLEAFSRPGASVPLKASPPPLLASELSQGMLALALALCDRDTPIWLDEAADTPEARHHLRFHCATPFTANPSEASFAFIARPGDMPRLHAFNQGRADFPDRSATLVISAGVSQNREEGLELTGPGVKGNDKGAWRPFGVAGLPIWFWEDWEENHAAYPLGVDVVFVHTETDAFGTSRARLLGLPRTARVRRCAGPSGSFAAKERTACM